MLIVELEMASVESGREVDTYSLGHITLKTDQGILTSKNQSVNQSSMIFLSIVELLDGIRRLALDSKSTNYNFVAIGSSFQFFLIKADNKDGLLTLIDGKRKNKYEVAQSEVVLAVWEGVSKFMASYGKQLHPEELVFSDLHNSIQQFRDEFDLDI